MTTNGSAYGVPHGLTATVELHLHIDDRELCEELSRYDEGRERHDFAVSAMRIGAIALRQAQGRIDAEQVRQEGDRFVENLGHALSNHQSEVVEQITGCLKDYFDPTGGLFSERVRLLVQEDGELERLIRGQIEGDGSVLVRTLDSRVGKDSPLMQTLDPESTGGLITQLTKSTEDTLDSQRERILTEFSLDNKEGALSRLIDELRENHGEVSEALQERIDAVTAEFSLDREDSALSRLVNRVEQAQRQITKEFSLDEEGSALARMRSELLDGIEKQRETNEKFQEDVIEKLADMTARKQESERSTRHGKEFEYELFDYINERSQAAGDIATHVGESTGIIRNNKRGDIVVELGQEHVAAGAKIVLEAKQDASYSPERALVELKGARENRGADVGIFVFSKRTADEGITPFSRQGNDIVIVWDSEDPGSDAYLEAGLSVAKALSVRAQAHSEEVGPDLEAMEKALLEVERQVKGLGEIDTWTTTIKSNSDKILDRVRIMRAGLKTQTAILQEKLASLRDVVSAEG